MAKTVNRDWIVRRGTLIKRYKRFLADVKTDDNDTLTVMCPNTGSMKTCVETGRPVVISDSQNPDRKYLYTWELIRMGRTWVNVNTHIPNRAVHDWIAAGDIKPLAGYATLKREQKYGHDGRSRIDVLCLDHADRPDCWVEVKNTSMVVGDVSVFPDSVTERGQKHLRELTDLVKQGQRAAMVYFIGRTDTRAFRPAHEIDPEYARLFKIAVKAGVEVYPLQVRFTPKIMRLEGILPVVAD